MSALLLLVLSAGALLCCVDAQAAYNQLPDNYKKGVDMALEQINTYSSIQHHFNYFRDLKKSDIQVLCMCSMSGVCTVCESGQ